MCAQMVRTEENAALLERLLDLRHGDRAFAADPPGVASQFHDRRGQRPAGFTGV